MKKTKKKTEKVDVMKQIYNQNKKNIDLGKIKFPAVLKVLHTFFKKMGMNLDGLTVANATEPIIGMFIRTARVMTNHQDKDIVDIIMGLHINDEQSAVIMKDIASFFPANAIHAQCYSVLENDATINVGIAAPTTSVALLKSSGLTEIRTKDIPAPENGIESMVVTMDDLKALGARLNKEKGDGTEKAS